MPEPLLQEPRDLTNGNAGLRHLELDVARPGAGKAARSELLRVASCRRLSWSRSPLATTVPSMPCAASPGGASNGSMTTRREVTASRIMIATPMPMTVATSAIKS